MILQISSYRHHTRVDSKQVSSNSSVSQFLKQNVTSPFEITLPVRPTSRLSTTTLVIQPENPFNIQVSRGRSRSTVNSAASLSGSSLKGQSNTRKRDFQCVKNLAKRSLHVAHYSWYFRRDEEIQAPRDQLSCKRTLFPRNRRSRTRHTLLRRLSKMNLQLEPR